MTVGKATKNEKGIATKSTKGKIVQTLAKSMDLLKFERNQVRLDLKYIEIIKSFYRRENVSRFMPKGSPPEVFL